MEPPLLICLSRDTSPTSNPDIRPTRGRFRLRLLIPWDPGIPQDGAGGYHLLGSRPPPHDDRVPPVGGVGDDETAAIILHLGLGKGKGIVGLGVG